MNYLKSALPNAIIMNYGDNDTFPLWYAQEVEGVRTDVRVMNMSYLGAEWYIDQMRIEEQRLGSRFRSPLPRVQVHLPERLPCSIQRADSNQAHSGQTGDRRMDQASDDPSHHS